MVSAPKHSQPNGPIIIRKNWSLQVPSVGMAWQAWCSAAFSPPRPPINLCLDRHGKSPKLSCFCLLLLAEWRPFQFDFAHGHVVLQRLLLGLCKINTRKKRGGHSFEVMEFGEFLQLRMEQWLGCSPWLRCTSTIRILTKSHIKLKDYDNSVNSWVWFS